MPRRRAHDRHMILLVLILLCWPQWAGAHQQKVHQYIAHEAYKLLVQKTGRDIPELTMRIGLAGQSLAGDSAWQKGYVTTGAWREDDEDVVYHYDVLPGMNYALTSISHFWDADQGDFTKNMIRLVVERPPLPPLATDIGPYPNALDKLIKFAHGGWVFFYPRAIICQNTSNAHYLVIAPILSTEGFGIPLEYDGLASFYRDHTAKVRADQPSVCTVFDVNDLKTINLSDVTAIRVDEDVCNTVVWEVLGRMCHLLGDMSVPAHVHRDEHGLNPDSYEEYVGGPGEPYSRWDHTNVGEPLILNRSSDEVLHFLMYVTQQQADHFGSNGPSEGTGDDVIGGNPSTAESEYLTAVGLGSLGGPTSAAGPWTVESMNIIRDKTLPMAIRAVAGLLYWFCREAGILNEPLAVRTGQAEEGQAESFLLLQNYPNPFNPRTVVSSQLPVASWVRLAVYDLLGREVAVLVDEWRPAGMYHDTFDADGHFSVRVRSAPGGQSPARSGMGLASGVYICRLTAQSLVASRTMLLLR